MPSWSSCSAKLQMLDQHQPGLVQARVPPRKPLNCCRAPCILATAAFNLLKGVSDAGPETALVATPSNGEDQGPAGTVFVNMAAAPLSYQYHTLSVQAHANSINHTIARTSQDGVFPGDAVRACKGACREGQSRVRPTLTTLRCSA